MSYVCAKCGAEIDTLDNLRCPKCAHRIIYKKRPAVAKKIQSR